jgi:HPt (histidine-containing phosphotransfer) domain-containing protein
MVQNNASAVAFSMPGGETCAKARTRPVDLVHLARQTMGDRALEQEVLGLFVQQALNVRDQIGRATPAEKLQLVHGIKGSARSVGAFAIGDWAEQIEQSPDDRQLMARLGRLIDELREFIAAIGR